MTNELWKFETKRFVIVCDALPEDLDPADSFEFPEDIEAVRNGDVEWFCARVRVLDKDGRELGADHLGGCAYKTFSEFVTSHRDSDPLNRNSSIMRQARGENTSICHYFPSMVNEALKEARRNAKRYCDLRDAP